MGIGEQTDGWRAERWLVNRKLEGKLMDGDWRTDGRMANRRMDGEQAEVGCHSGQVRILLWFISVNLLKNRVEDRL